MPISQEQSICREQIMSENFVDLILWNYSTREGTFQEYGTSCIDFPNSQYAILYIDRNRTPELSFDTYGYLSIPKLYTLLDSTNMESSGIIQNFNSPVLNLRGEGTMIGFIDTGIDYQNPLFQTSSGKTRILGLWDQNNQDGVPPNEISYGTEYKEADINRALESDAPLSVVPSTDTNGHGTFVAGIAAGGEDIPNQFIGAAPECTIGVVKLKPAKLYLRDLYLILPDAIAYQETDLMMGVRYLVNLAKERDLPLVICITLGTNQGGHEGTTPLGNLLSKEASERGCAIVIAAGNETGRSHHYFGTIPQGSEYEDVELRVSDKDSGFTIELWGREPELYSVGFVSPTGERVARLPTNSSRTNVISFFLEKTVIQVDFRIVEFGSGSQLIIMRFQDPTPGIWTIRVFNSVQITGEYHMWLPITGFISESTVFLRPNPDTTITEPSATYQGITASTYNHVNNSLYIHSSRGYTRYGRIKPDLAAPGVDIYGPGLNQQYTRKTGSSIAAAHVAGAAANIFTWGVVRGNDPIMNSRQIKSYMIRGAERNAALSYPNKEWGYGTLNLYNIFEHLRDM